MRIMIFSLVVVVFTWPAIGEVQSLTGADRFSDDAVLLSLQGFGVFMPAKNLFVKWGVRFGGQEGAVTFNVALCPGPDPCPPGLGILSNTVGPECSTDLPLVIDSETPLRRIGFILVPHDCAYNHSQPVSAKTTITAFDQYGRSLGSIVREGAKIFAGLEVSGKEGISRVTIKSDEGIEGIADLVLDYTTRPQFTTFLPQLADGGGVHTSVTFLNLSDSTAEGSIRIYSPQGELTNLGSVHSDTSFVLPPRSSSTVVTSGGEGQLKTGHATVTSNCPLRVQAVYTTRQSDEAVREAGVVSAAAYYASLGSVIKESENGTDTAFALVNPHNSVLIVRAYLASTEAGFAEMQKQLVIPAHGQVAT